MSTAPTSQDSVTWPELLALATSIEGVVDIARDFTASFTPHEIASLPPGCAPPHRFGASEEIAGYAFTLVRHQCDAGGDNVVLFRMANFFSHAARSMARLMSEAARAKSANAPLP